MTELGWKSVDVPELTALPGIEAALWFEVYPGVWTRGSCCEGESVLCPVLLFELDG